MGETRAPGRAEPSRRSPRLHADGFLPRLPGQLRPRRGAVLVPGRRLPCRQGTWRALDVRCSGRSCPAVGPRCGSAPTRCTWSHSYQIDGAKCPADLEHHRSERMRDPYEVLGVPQAQARTKSRRPSASLPRGCIRTPTGTTRRRPKSSPSSTRPMRSSATRTSARHSTAARSTRKASRDFRASRASAAAPGAGRGGPGGTSRPSASGPTGSAVRASRGGAAGGGVRGHPVEVFGVRSGRGRSGPEFNAEDFGPSCAATTSPRAHDHAHRGCPWRQAACPASDRQGRRSQDSGRH